jgi:hypothetical protein
VLRQGNDIQPEIGDLTYGLPKLNGIEWLLDVGVSVQRVTGVDIVRKGGIGQDDAGDMPVVVVGFDFGKQLKAIESWKLQVEQDQGWERIATSDIVSVEIGERLSPILDRMKVILRFIAQGLHNEQCVMRIILD